MKREFIQQTTPPAPKPRWRILFAGFLLALMGGFSYSWGVMVLPIMERFGWTKGEAVLPFTVFMVVFAMVMVPGGKLQDRYGPRIISAIGGVLFFLAYGLAALVGIFPYAWWLVITYGLLGGSACGLTYACVAPPARKWFPDKPAFAVSSTVMGFGLSALVVAPIKSQYLIPVLGIERTFLIISGLMIVVILLASRMIENPPDGWAPSLMTSTQTSIVPKVSRVEFTPREIIGKKSFWTIWITFGLMISGGLMAIGLIPSYGISIGFSPSQSALALSIFSGFNGFGRPLAGLLADRFGTLRVMIVAFLIQTIVLLSFPILSVSLPGLFASSALLGWGFAVTLGLFPVLTSTCFGVKHFGSNYGLVFTAFGAGALAPSLGSWLSGITGSDAQPFIAAGLLAAIGLVLCILMELQKIDQYDW